MVRVEETEVWGAGYLASGPVDKTVRSLAGVTYLSSGTGCTAGAMMPGAIGTLFPPDSDSIGPVGPYGTLSPPDSDSVGPVGPYGTPSPSDSDPVGPVGPFGMLSPSDSDPVGPVGPRGMLSTSDLAGILVPAVPAGIPFPVGPVGPVGLRRFTCLT